MTREELIDKAKTFMDDAISKGIVNQWAIMVDFALSLQKQVTDEEITKRIKSLIEYELGGYKTIHIGEPKTVLSAQFVYEQDIDNLSKELTFLFKAVRDLLTK